MQPLSAAIRELLYSEALYHLGIPTVRTGALLASREELVPVVEPKGAILTQVHPFLSVRPLARLIPVRPCELDASRVC